MQATCQATLNLGCFSVEVLHGYFDSVHGDNHDKRFTGGYIFLLYGSLISWQSMVQKVIALSTTEAEYMSTTEAGCELVWIRGILQEIGRKIELRDNTGSNALAKNPEFHQRTKHIELCQRFITSLVECRTVDVAYIPSKAMLADETSLKR